MSPHGKVHGKATESTVEILYRLGTHHDDGLRTRYNTSALPTTTANQFLWPIFFWRLLQVRSDPPKAFKGQPLGIVGAGCFTDWITFMSQH